MKTTTRQIAVLILAAGASRRLGRPKQLLKMKGKTLLRRTTELALSLETGLVIVVVGARAEQMRAELEGLNVYILYNTDWEEGMSTSLRRGITFLESLPILPIAVLALVVDQPKVNEDLLKRIIAAYREKRPPIAASFYSGRHGTPALFDHSLFRELKIIEGDRGARRVIKKYERDLIAIDFPDGNLDIDTEEDLHRLNL